jgi:hypothetical protein
MTLVGEQQIMNSVQVNGFNGNKKKSLEHISCHIPKYFWNIIIPLFFLGDVSKYSLMKPKIFYLMDEGPTWKHKLLF